MNKTIVIIFMSFIMTLFQSCSDDVNIAEVIPTTSDNGNINDPEFEAFISSVDSLNNTYQEHASRGFWSNVLAVGSVTIADQAGRVAGSVIGRWAGGAVGVVTANPVVGCVGVVAGGRIGGTVGYIAASAAAKTLISKAHSNPFSTQSTQVETDFNIHPSEFQYAGISPLVTQDDKYCDSLGYYHNYVIAKIMKTKDKYIYADGTLNGSILYDDIVKYLKELNVDIHALEESDIIKNNIITLTNEIALQSLSNVTNNGSNELLLDAQCSMLKQKYFLDNRELQEYKSVTLAVVTRCCTLSDVEIHNYAKDLNRIIATSNMSDEQKFNAAVAANCTINSTLCWKE